MRYGFINNFQQTLASELAAGATTLTLSGGGEALADASSDYRYKLTLIERNALGVETHREIVDVTGVAGNDLTIEGEQEGTSRLAGGWPSGTAALARVTAGHFEAITEEVMVIGQIDFGDAESFAEVAMPPGALFFVDGIEVIPLDTVTGGYGLIESGPVGSIDNTVFAVEYIDGGSKVSFGHFGEPYLTIADRSTLTPVSSSWYDSSLGSGGVASLARSPNGEKLAVGLWGSPYLVVLDLVGETVESVTATLGSAVLSVAWRPDGGRLVVGLEASSGALKVLDATDNYSDISIASTTTFDWAYVVSYSPDGTMIGVSHEGDGIFDVLDDATLDNIAANTTPAAGGSRSTSHAWSPDGSVVLVARFKGSNERLTSFDTATWTETEIDSPEITGQVMAIAWRLDGERFATAGDNSDFCIYSWPSLNHLLTTTAAFGANGVAFNPAEDEVVGVAGFGDYIYFMGPEEFTASLNVGADSSTSTEILEAASVPSFDQHIRVPIPTVHNAGMASLYASPSASAGQLSPAVVVARGYLLSV